MAQARLIHVKREIRVLGLAARRVNSGFIVIGVVYRGNKWLDGVIFGRSMEVNFNANVVDIIRRSPHYGQIRVIILSRTEIPEALNIDLDRLNVDTQRPIIFFDDEAFNLTDFNESMYGCIKFVGISRWTGKRILRNTSTSGVLPEALKVAGLIADALLKAE